MGIFNMAVDAALLANSIRRSKGQKQWSASPTNGTDYTGLFGTNSNKSEPGAFNYARPQSQPAPAPEPTTDESQYAGLLDGGGDTSVSNHDMMHTMSAIDSAFGGKSPMELYTLRQQLARQKALALGGMLPADQQGNGFDGAGITEGTPNYNFQDTQAVNKATGDIFDPQIESLDNFLHDTVSKSSSGKNTDYLDSVSGSDLSDINNQIISALAMNEPTPERQNNIAKYYTKILQTQGPDAFMQLVAPKLVGNMSSTAQNKYNEITAAIPGYDAAFTTIINNPRVVSGFATAKFTDAAKKLNRQGDNTYLLLQQQLEAPQSKARVQTAGTALTGTEKAQVEKNFFAESDTTQDIARKLAYQIAALTAYEQTEPFRQAHFNDKKIQEMSKNIYYSKLAEYSEQIKPYFPSAAAAINSSIPKSSKTSGTPAQGSNRQPSSNNYGGLI